MAILPHRRPSHSCPTGPERRRGASALPGSPGGRTEAHGGFRQLSALPAGLFSVAVAELLSGSASERSDVEHGRAARRAGWALTPDQRWRWACRQRHFRGNRHRHDCGSVGPRGAANASRLGSVPMTTARWYQPRKGLLTCCVRTPSARSGPASIVTHWIFSQLISSLLTYDTCVSLQEQLHLFLRCARFGPRCARCQAP